MQQPTTAAALPRSAGAAYPVSQQRPVPVIREGHTQDNPLCLDWHCSCHHDPMLLGKVASFYSVGLLTHSEAVRLMNGEML